MTSPNYDKDRGLALLRTMERIRAFEEQAEQAAVRDELVLGAIHLSIGQEAVAAGIVSRLRRDDLLLSTHRGHGHTLAKGAEPTAMMKELLGREGGCCGGKGGSMHIADFGVGMLGANGIVGANISIAAGAAHGIKLLGDDRIVACFFGDGAINRGPFLEGLNWAGVFDLPILFVCEDNQYSASTQTASVVPTVAWNYPTPATLSVYLAKQSAGIDDSADEQTDAPALDDEFEQLLGEIEGLSEEAVKKMLDP